MRLAHGLCHKGQVPASSLLVCAQVKALEAAEAARRKEAARAAERAKQKDQADKQKAERHKHAQNMKARLTPL